MNGPRRCSPRSAPTVTPDSSVPAVGTATWSTTRNRNEPTQVEAHAHHERAALLISQSDEAASHHLTALAILGHPRMSLVAHYLTCG